MHVIAARKLGSSRVLLSVQGCAASRAASTSSVSATRYGFIGLGNMGASMALNLSASAGDKVFVYDVVAANASLVVEKAGGKAVTASSVAELAAACNVIITMVPNTQHVQTLMESIFKHAKQGSLIIDCSTIDPITSRNLSREAAALPSKLVMMDAPVSGGVTGAAAATLTFMCGGTDEAVRRASPVLSLMGKKIVHCGEAGSGGVTKLCNNLSLAISMAGTAEALNLGIKLGMDGKKLAEVMNTSTARCWSSDSYNPVPGIAPNVPSSRDYEGGFGSALMLKDLKLALDSGRGGGLDLNKAMPMGSRAAQLYTDVCDAGLAQRDFSVVYKYFKG